MVFTNTDGQVVAITIPNDLLSELDVVILPQQNEIGQPIVGNSETSLVWSPGGRYLAIGEFCETGNEYFVKFF